MDGVCRGAALSFKENFKKYNNDSQQKKKEEEKAKKIFQIYEIEFSGFLMADKSSLRTKRSTTYNKLEKFTLFN